MNLLRRERTGKPNEEEVKAVPLEEKYNEGGGTGGQSVPLDAPTQSETPPAPPPSCFSPLP